MGLADAPTRNVALRRWWPWARRAVGVGIFVAGVSAAVENRHRLAAAGHRLGHVQGGWLIVAVVVEALSLVVFAQLQKILLAAGGVNITWWRMIEISFAGMAVAKSLPGGGAFSAAWEYGQVRRRGASGMLAGWTVLMAGALSSFALFVVIAAGTVIAGGSGPVASLRWLAAGLAAIPVVGTAAALIARRESRLRHAVNGALNRIGEGRRSGWTVRSGSRALAALRVVRPAPSVWVQASALAVVNWLADLACLAASIYAVGGRVPWRGLLVAYGLAQVAAALPFTPGGIALVEGSLSALLIAYRMPADTAVAAVLLYRIVSFWGLVPLGWATYGLLGVHAARMPAPAGGVAPVGWAERCPHRREGGESGGGATVVPGGPDVAGVA